MAESPRNIVSLLIYSMFFTFFFFNGMVFFIDIRVSFLWCQMYIIMFSYLVMVSSPLYLPSPTPPQLFPFFSSSRFLFLSLLLSISSLKVLVTHSSPACPSIRHANSRKSVLIILTHKHFSACVTRQFCEKVKTEDFW